MGRLRADTAAIVLADLQSSTVGMLPKDDQVRLTTNLRVTLEIAAALHLPIIVTSNLEDGPQGAVLEVIEKSAPGPFSDRIRRNGRFDAFAVPDFADAIAATRRSTLLIAGFPLDVPVMQTTLSALERGFETHVLVNCSGSPSPRAFDIALQRLTREGATPSWSISAMAEMAQGFDTPGGLEMMKILMEHVIFSGEGNLD